MTTRLLLFANSFPFGNQEPYLMREVDFYDRFDEVFVFSLSIRAHQRGSQRPLASENIRVVPLHFRSPLFYALNAARSLLNRALLEEVLELARTRRLSLRRLIQVLSHYSRADHEARVISTYIRDTITDHPGDRTVLYAYRFLYQPYLASRVASAFHDVRLIGRAHGIDLYEERSGTGYLPGRRRNLAVLDELHCVSEHGADYLRAKYPEFAQKIRTTYLGTEDQGVRAEPIPGLALRLVSCSNVVGVKRIDLLIEALCALPEDVKVEWVHYGDGDQFEEVSRMAHRLPGHVEANLPGRVNNDEVLRAYRAGKHDVLINVSSSEGLPVALMEACSAGLPVIATDVGGTREVIANDVNGILLRADAQAEEIARAIQKFAQMSVAEYAVMSLASRQSWEDEFNSARNYPEFMNVMLPSQHIAACGHPASAGNCQQEDCPC